MPLLDMYRNMLMRKREELTKLNQDLAKEQAKLAQLQNAIISADNAIKRTKNPSTIRTRLNEKDRLNKSIADVHKKIGEIEKKKATKDKEIVSVDKSCRIEENRVQSRQAAEDRKRLKEATLQSRQLEQRLSRNEFLQMQMQKDIKQLQTVPKVITVLFLAANPVDTPLLKLDEEARSIQQKIRMSDYRDSIHFESRWALRSGEILQAINETNPTIVHFSGHGAANGDLILLNPDGTYKTVSKDAISNAMATASDTIRLIVFNTCFSESQAENVVKYIESAIGMSTSISDEAACVFASQLYSSIGFGRSLQKSFNQAIAQLILEGIPEEKTPKLYVKHDVDASEVFLVQP